MRFTALLLLWFFAFGAALLLLVDPLAEVYVHGVPSDLYLLYPLCISLALNAFLATYTFLRLLTCWTLVYRSLAWAGPGADG